MNHFGESSRPFPPWPPQGLMPAPTQEVELICAATIEPEPMAWLWPNWLAKGALHFLLGAPGIGTTSIALHFAMAVAHSGFRCTWPDNSHGPTGKVVIWCDEANLAKEVIPRLKVIGEDISHIYFIDNYNNNGRIRPFDPEQDMPRLKAKMRSLGNVQLLIMDPVGLGTASGLKKCKDLRTRLDPLVQLAEEFDCAVLALTVLPKGGKGNSAVGRVDQHSGIFSGAPIVMVAEEIKSNAEVDPDDAIARRCVLYRARNKIGLNDVGYIFHIKQTSYISRLGLIATTRPIWHGTPVVGNPDEISSFAQGSSQMDMIDKASEAVAFLRSILAYGAVPFPIIQIAAQEARISYPTLKRAKRKLGIRSKKQFGMGSANPFEWELPSMAPGQWAPTDLGSAFSRAEQRKTFMPNGAVEPVELVEAVEPVEPVDPVEPVEPVAPVEPVEPVATIPNGASYLEVTRSTDSKPETIFRIEPDTLRSYAEECHVRFKASSKQTHPNSEEDSRDDVEELDKIIDATLELHCLARPHRAAYRSELQQIPFWEDDFASSPKGLVGANRWRN